MSDYPYHKVEGDKEDPDEDKVVNKLIAFLKGMCSIKLSGSGDHVGKNGGPFSSGTFLTLTSKNGGSGPAIHSSGNIKIIYVDIDTLPGLLGLARGRGAIRYKSRSGYKSSCLAKALAAVSAPNDILKGKNALIKVKTSVQEALMTEIRAGDQFFNNDTDSALVREKGAMEMAGEVDNGMWVPNNLRDGSPVSTKFGTQFYQKGDTLFRDSVPKDELKNNFYYYWRISNAKRE